MPTAEQAQLLDRLSATPRDLMALLGGTDAARLNRRPEPGEWSARDVVVHLADAELVYSVRLRLIVAENRPLLTAFDENAWGDRFARVEEDVRDTVTRWRTLREGTIRMLQSLEEAEWARTGVHAERGVLSVADVGRLLVSHDADHLAQIRAALA